jgi:hypothetical protein
MKKGYFVISLDFELHWGSIELLDINSKNTKEYFENTRKAIPFILELFSRYTIHCTWATVGLLFAKNKEQAIKFSPILKPSYLNKDLNYYNYLFSNNVGKDEKSSPFHFANSIIESILKVNNQELGSHTFGHYYCNEVGQNINEFDADLKSAQELAKENFGITLKSLVLPRNQFNLQYLKIIDKNGFNSVRTNPNVWFWNHNLYVNNIIRALDSMFSFSGNSSYKLEEMKKISNTTLIPSSRFKRGYKENEKYIRPLFLKRIKEEMTYAAVNNEVYHLWWHPHNFGNNVNESISFLESILKHYNHLNSKYNFESATMNELANLREVKICPV